MDCKHTHYRGRYSFDCSCGRADGSHDYHCDSVPAILDEMAYKDFAKAIVPNLVPGATLADLPTRDWGPLLKECRYIGYRGDTFEILVNNNYNGWSNYYKWDEWNDVVTDTSLNANEAARLLLWAGNLRMFCPCPSFTFWGYAYILTQLDSEIFREDRFPKVRNRQLKGFMCKHGRKSLKTLPMMLLPKMAAAIKETRSKIERGLPLIPPPSSE